MLKVSADALNRFGLELDVLEAGKPSGPTEQGAKMTASCVNSQDAGINMQANVDTEERTCFYIREGTWKWLEPLLDPEGPRNNTPKGDAKPWAVNSLNKKTPTDRETTLRNIME